MTDVASIASWLRELDDDCSVARLLWWTRWEQDLTWLRSQKILMARLDLDFVDWWLRMVHELQMLVLL